MRYYDTSALYSLFVPQPFSEAAEQEVERDLGQIITSELSFIEFRTILNRDIVDGNLSVAEANIAWEGFFRKRHSYYYRIIELNKLAVQDSLDLLQRALEKQLAVRTLDTIHVAAAYAYNQVGFVTADKQQAAFAKEIGLATSLLD